MRFNTLDHMQETLMSKTTERNLLPFWDTKMLVVAFVRLVASLTLGLLFDGLFGNVVF